MLGDFGCFGKRSMHDASVRVPLIVRYPQRFFAGQQCTTATSLCDLFPTFLGASGIPRTELDLDGEDLAEIAAKPDSERVIYSQFGGTDRAIYMAASERWKYVYSAGDHREFCFDRQADPMETTNLVTADNMPDAGDALKDNLLAYLRAVDATEAYEEQDSKITWRLQPRVDEEYLKDPDAGLLVQDYPSYATDLPGYV